MGDGWPRVRAAEALTTGVTPLWAPAAPHVPVRLRPPLHRLARMAREHEPPSDSYLLLLSASNNSCVRSESEDIHGWRDRSGPSGSWAISSRGSGSADSTPPAARDGVSRGATSALADGRAPALVDGRASALADGRASALDEQLLLGGSSFYWLSASEVV